MTAITALLTNKAHGYPTRGTRRRRKPTILACLHQTSNATATAIQERNYANRAGSWGPSATAYIDRDGTIVPRRRSCGTEAGCVPSSGARGASGAEPGAVGRHLAAEV